MGPALNDLVRTLRSGDGAPELRVVESRPALPPRCERCSYGGIVRVIVSRGSLPYRPGDVEYCSCVNGDRRRRLDERDCQEYYGSLDTAYEQGWDATLGLSGRMHDWTLETFPRARASRYHDWAVNYVHQWDGKRNLVVHGTVGAGKTGLVIAVLNAIRPRLIRAHYSARFVVAPDMFDHLRAGFDEGDFEARLRAYETCHLLILDDLGTESGSNFEMKRLYQILNARYNAQLPTWITSNLDLQPNGTGALANWLGMRVTSRILENGDLVSFRGRDLRLRE